MDNVNGGLGEWGDVVEYDTIDGEHGKFLVTQPGIIELPTNTVYCKVNNEIVIDLPRGFPRVR